MTQTGEAVSPATPNARQTCEGAGETAGQETTEYASEFCPRCSARLAARSCKMICPGCGYYMSCSDFY